MDSEKFTDFNDFVSSGDKFFDPDRVSCIQKVNIAIDNVDNCLDDASFLKPWIDAAVKRKVQHLDVYCFTDDFIYEMPVSLYSCEALVFLKLFEVTLDDAPIVSLPCLKTLHLENLVYSNDAFFQRLVSGCPVLEELKILGCLSTLQVTRVHSLSLKSLQIELLMEISDNQFVIDAPLLRCLKIDDCESASYYIVNKLDSNAKLDISLVFGLEELDDASVSSRRNSIRDFLSGISKVGEMIIYLDIFKIFHLYSKLEPLPQFDCMSRLDATICVSELKWLPTFLECCPNLKSLVLALDDYYKINSEEMNQISFSSVPECLLSSLISVDIKSIISGYAAEMKLVRYFLKNSIILKKVTIRLSYRASANVILKKLLKIPRRSITCLAIVR